MRGDCYNNESASRSVSTLVFHVVIVVSLAVEGRQRVRVGRQEAGIVIVSVARSVFARIGFVSCHRLVACEDYCLAKVVKSRVRLR
jgi:hypothetical protein